MSPVFTIIVPVYRVEAYLAECLDSILAQTFPDFELILVDDGSPDGCPAICDGYAARDERVAVLHKENGGVLAARRDGLRRARGAYICFVDGDDRVADTFLETLWGYIDAYHEPDILTFGLVYDTADGRVPEEIRPAPGYYDKARLTREIYPGMLYDRAQPFFHKRVPGAMCARATRRELLLEHFTSDDRIRLLEDICMVFECLYHADAIYVCPEHLYDYRIHDASAMGSYSPDYIRQLSWCADYLRAHLCRDAPETLPQVNGYLAFRIIDALVRELRHAEGDPRAAAARVRRAMDESGLMCRVGLRGLPMYIKAFVLLLKLRLYRLAVLATKLRMGQTAGPAA